MLMEGSGEDKERREEGMEDDSKVDGGDGGDAPENDRPKQQKRKWGSREGR